MARFDGFGRMATVAHNHADGLCLAGFVMRFSLIWTGWKMPEKDTKRASEAPQSKGTEKPERQTRLSKALRDNLKRRKAQSRKRGQSNDE